MSSDLILNELYLAVLPMIRLGESPYPVEEVLTLYPDKNFATNFFPDEIGFFLNLIKKRTQHLMGGHVVRYDFATEQMEDGRQIVRVTQVVRGTSNA